jgi:uncharacterized membrane protein YraQ (UPF0718 family)
VIDAAEAVDAVADTEAADVAAEAEDAPPRFPLAVWAAIAVLGLSPGTLSGFFSSAALESWGTVFLSLTLQALPFLVLGIVVSASISAFVPSGWLARAVPRRPLVAVPVAGLAGAVLPGCECSSVPVAGRLAARGVPQAAALTFLLAAPAINPVVMVATAVAFPGRPEMVAARFGASLLTAITVGLVWGRFASPDWLERRLDEHEEHSHGRAFVDTALSDLLQAGGFLVLGAALVATLQSVVPRSVLDGLGGGGLGPVLVLAALAVVLSICSEADAFVAAGLTQFSLTARLAFLVVGPMVDVKLIALHAGTFGRRFALRFDPLVLVVAVVVSLLVGAVAW